MTDLKQLRTFLAVADTGSLSKASDRLRLAQPALSRQIKLLEAEIGRALFVRFGRGMQLTDAGKLLLERISGLVLELEKSFDDVRSLDTVPSGRVALGMMPTTSYILSGRIARRIAHELPHVSLRIVEAYAGHLIEWLHKGSVDLSLLYGPSTDLHLRTTELLYEELVLVGPRSAADRLPDTVRVEALAGMPLVLPSRPHGLRMVVEAAAVKAGVRLAVRFEADSFRVLKTLVRTGLGFTVLPPSSLGLENEEEHFQTAALVGPKVTRQVVLALPFGRSDTKATTAVKEILLDEIGTLVRRGEWKASPASGLLQS